METVKNKVIKRICTNCLYFKKDYYYEDWIYKKYCINLNTEISIDAFNTSNKQCFVPKKNPKDEEQQLKLF